MSKIISLVLLKAAELEALRGHRGSANLRKEAFLTLRVLVAKVSWILISCNILQVIFKWYMFTYINSLSNVVYLIMKFSQALNAQVWEDLGVAVECRLCGIWNISYDGFVWHMNCFIFDTFELDTCRGMYCIVKTIQSLSDIASKDILGTHVGTCPGTHLDWVWL